MQIDHLLVELEQQVDSQLRFADPLKVDLISEVLEMLNPAVRQTMFRVVEAAMAEINSQLTGEAVEIRLVDGDPELIVTTAAAPPPLPPEAPDTPEAEGFDEARITLRIPGYLKEIIADAARNAGDSVNSYVVDALRTATPPASPRKSVNRKIQL